MCIKLALMNRISKFQRRTQIQSQENYHQYENETHLFKKRLVNPLWKICHSCSRVNNGAMVVWCCWNWWINFYLFSFHFDTLQIYIVMRPEIYIHWSRNSFIKLITCLEKEHSIMQYNLMWNGLILRGWMG